MRLEKYAFKKLPFSALFQTYTGDFNQVADFFSVNPFDEEQVAAAAASSHFKGNRSHSARLLKSFNNRFDAKQAVFNNIDRLQQDNALAIVTGQQLGLYGGPLYTIYKTLTTIHLARRWEEKLDRPVIPVFWLADEDHDYDEVKSMQVITDEGVESFSLPGKKGELPPVADLSFPDEITSVRSSLESALIDTDFSNDLWTLLDGCFTPGVSFRQGFGNYIAQLFSGYGLVLAGSNHPEIKKELRKPLVESVENADALREALEKQSEKIDQKYHRQASVYNSHLFYLHPEEGRIKIHHPKDDDWHTDAGMQWSKKELIDEIQDAPEKFSPDVFLRPVLQDALLPTLGYVAGPGEIAYYGQMQSFYGCFDQKMPVIFPRLSATLVEPAIDRILDELPFKLNAYLNRVEDLESDFVDRTEQTDIESLFEEWKEEAKTVAKSRIKEITKIDETLEGAGEKVQATYVNELDKLKGKVYRAVKKSEEIQLNRIHRIQQNLFPGRSLQERTLCGIYYMNKFGVDIWDRLLDEMDEQSLDSHTLIYI